MPVLLSTYGSRGDVEPMVGLAVRLRALGAELLARVGVPLVPVGQPVRPLVTGARPSWSPRSSTRSPRRPRDVTRWWRSA